MLKIYFDNVLIDEDSYTGLSNDFQLFTDSFKLGSVASNSFKLSVNKSVVENHPSEVKIEDDNTTFYLVVDSITEDKYVYNYTLVDKLINFNFNYDASGIINSKHENEEVCYLSDIWKDMCIQAGVEYDEDYVFENDIVVTWYDNRVQARRYLSFIAELQSGYVCILENGKQSFKKQKRSSVKTIDADECSDLIIGEKKTITRVVFDGGAFKWEFGDDTGETLYLQSDNVFIVNEDIVENIYNNIKDFEFYIIEAPQAPMDSTIKAGDVITFNDNGTLYPTIAQYSMSYAGGWTGGYQLQVNTERQQETQITRTSQQVRNIQTKVDRLDNEFSVIAEEIEKLTDYIRNVGNTGDNIKLPNTPKSSGAINTLRIRGFELMPLYPGMAYPSEYTYPGVLNFYTLIFDTVPTFDSEPNYVFVNSPIPLQKLGSVNDELLIEANKVKVIQRIGYDFDNEQWSVLSTPITHELNDVLLPTFDGDTYISVRYFDNLTYDAEYIIKNDLTSVFSTQLESKSQFKISQDEISSKVSKDNLISEINQTAEKVKIKADKIGLEGLVTANENFKILLDGSIEANKGTFKGDIFLPDGGRVIGGEGILTNFQFRSGAMERCGYDFAYMSSTFFKRDLEIIVNLPTNFTIIEAKVTIFHAPIKWYNDMNGTDGWGYARKLKLYKDTTTDYYAVAFVSSTFYPPTPSSTEIVGAFGTDGYTPSIPSDSNHILEETTSIDIKTSLSSGLNVLRIQPSYTLTAETGIVEDETAIKNSGWCSAVINIIGYQK